MELVQTHLICFNKITITTNVQAFILVFSLKFFLLNPDPGGKMNADPCMRILILIHSPAQKVRDQQLFPVPSPH